MNKMCQIISPITFIFLHQLPSVDKKYQFVGINSRTQNKTPKLEQFRKVSFLQHSYSVFIPLHLALRFLIAGPSKSLTKSNNFVILGPVTFYCLGSLCSFIFGWFLSYNIIIWTNVFTCVLGAVLCFLVIESPLYLLRQGREEVGK